MGDPERVQRALSRLAEQRISEAIESGAFDNLPGAGKPISDLDEAYDELWWIKKWLRRERAGEIEQQPGEERFRRFAAIETLCITNAAGTPARQKPFSRNNPPPPTPKQ